MIFAYADPPYLGSAKKLYSKHHAKAAEWDNVETHGRLIEGLSREFPDGWALSMASTNLRVLLPLCPADVRVGAWVKPFASFKPNVNPAYAWEPVVFRGGRKRGRDLDTVRDWFSANIMLKKGLTGAKPPPFCEWVFNFLGAIKTDTMHDIFPGTGIVSTTWADWTPK